MRPKHCYLSGNKGTETPSNLIFFDTETYATKLPGRIPRTVHKLRLWTAIRVRIEGDKITRRKVDDGEDAQSFWAFVSAHSDNHRSTWLFAHNLGFDLTQLDFWSLLDNGTYTIKPFPQKSKNQNRSKQRNWQGRLCLDSHPTYIICRQGRKTFRFVDTCNYWPKRLHDIGDSIGIPKQPLPSQDADNADWRNRCFRDCQIIEYAVCNLLGQWKREDCGVFQLTAASLALTNFRHTCKIRTKDADDVDIVCSPGAAHHDLERLAYFGGRMQCYFVGKVRGRIYHLDVNSLYPYVMREFSYPRRFVSYERDVSNERLDAMAACYGVAANVLIESRHETFPVRIDRKQYHCTGRFWTALSGPELQRAIRHGVIVRTDTVQRYSLAPLFRDWVDYWYSRKVIASEKGKAGAADLEFAKLLLNSLSGKFAQRGRHWKDISGKIPMRRWGGWVEYNNTEKRYDRWRGVGGNSQILADSKEPVHAFPLISAYITAYGREHMLQAINACPPGSVYYMATDSLICDHDAYKALESGGWLHPTEIGKFKCLGTHSECDILGPNWYRLDGREVASGWLGKLLRRQTASDTVEIWDKLPSIISRPPDGTVVAQEIPFRMPVPSYRGRIDNTGTWHPYRLTFDPEFGDRPPKAGYRLECFSDMPEVHTLVDGEASPLLSAPV